MLDRRQGDHAVLIRDAEAALATDASDESLDRLAFRAERLLTHHLVLRGGPQSERESLLRREAAPGEPRVFSLGIGGLDLGMARVLARASREGARLSWGSPTLRRAGSRPSAGEALRANVTSTKAALESRHETAAGLPEHGLIDTSSPEAERAFGGNWIRKAVRRAGDASYPTIEIVMSADGPDPRARRVVQDLSGRARWIQRVEAGRFLSYAFERTDSGLRAVRSVPLVAPADRERGVPISDAGSPRAVRPSAKNPSRYAILEILPPSLGERTVSSTADPDVDSPDIVLRLRSAGRSDREASFPRAVLQRIVLGPEVDLSAGRPLPGLGEPSLVLGDADVLLVMLSPEQTSPPWAGPTPPVPGEENPVRVAESLGRWWAATAKESARSVVVATDRERSPSRWLEAAGPLRKPILLVPDDAFPSLAEPMKDRLAGEWRSGQIVPVLPKKVPGRLVVLVSAEAPARLGERLRSLANDPRMSGKLLAVLSLSGSIRQDLPASLLADGRLAGIGIAQSGPEGWERLARGMGEFSGALAEGPSTIERVESVRGPFLWYF
jgi:hypothetical protein